MSEYQNAVGGRLKLKGKALDVKEGGVKKKKKKKKQQHREESSQIGHDEPHEGFSHWPIPHLLFKLLTIGLSINITTCHSLYRSVSAHSFLVYVL
jgi:hypothetical protein